MRHRGPSERQPWAFVMAAVNVFVDVLRVLRTIVSVSRMDLWDWITWRLGGRAGCLTRVPAFPDDCVTAYNFRCA